MTITPFLAIRLRNKKDAILARQRARRVASLLNFDGQEQACIAAGTFVVACQALTVFGPAQIYFQIENHQLQIFAESSAPSPPPTTPKRLAGMFPEVDPKSLFRLSKPLPPQDRAEELDLGWLVQQIEETAPEGAFAEITRQNQEILALLHQLRLCQGSVKGNAEKPASPHAA